MAREVGNFAELVESVTSRQVRLATIYGFRLTKAVDGGEARSSLGDTRVCFGLDMGGRGYAYVDALRAGAGPMHSSWGSVPGRAKMFWSAGYVYTGTGVFTLRGPAALESAAAFEACLAGYSLGDVCGGLLALNQSEPHVEDACHMQLWHDQGRCIAGR